MFSKIINYIMLFVHQDVSNTPSKGKKKKDRKQKGSVNGEEADKDRASPEANAQQQMAAQRASGGIIDAPPEVSYSCILKTFCCTKNKYIYRNLL